MIAAASDVADKCAQYCEFVVPALCELAEAVGVSRSDERKLAGKDRAATASIAEGTQVAACGARRARRGVAEHLDAIDAALRESGRRRGG